MNVTQTPLDVQSIYDVINKIVPVVSDEDHLTVVASLLTMVIMATYPQLEGEALITMTEKASQLLLTLAASDTVN